METDAAGLDAGFDAHLRVGGATFGRRDAELLRAIEACGSLHAAAADLGRSYSRAHGRIEELESAVGTLVERQRGGADGGGSTLTDRARELLAEFDRLTATLAGTAATEAVTIDGTVTEPTGRLVTVDTGVGQLKAVLASSAPSGDEPASGGTPGEQVSVTVPADAVTLHAPASAPAPDATSARNRFEGTVVDIERAVATARVQVDVGAATPLAVRVTTDSLDRLGLDVGEPIVATAKATAARAIPAESGD